MIADEPGQGFWVRLTEPERAALRGLGSWRHYVPDARILVEHEASDHVVVIWSGLAKVCTRTATGRHLILALRGPGDIVGEMASVGGGRRSATVVAVEDVRALVVSGARFGWFLERYPRASTVLHHVLASRLRDGDRLRVGAATMSVGQRLAGLLLQIGQRFGTPAGGGTRISLALSQKDLAAFVGASERAVAREMERWRQRDIIATGRRWIVIQQSPALWRIAGLSGPPR